MPSALTRFWRSLTTPFRGKPPARRSVAYAGAQQSRLTGDWILAPILSANREVQSDLTNLRRRSRELCRNHDAVKRYLKLCDTNIVGPDGIRLQAMNRTPDRKLDRALNAHLEERWKQFCRPRHASVSRRHSLHALARALVRAKKRDGDGLIRIVRGPGKFGFQLVELDADQLDHEFNRAPSKGVNEIRLGIEIDAHGAPVAYHIWNVHPTEYAHSRERIPVPAAEIIHLYDADRAGQLRGVPAPHAVLFRIQMLRGYEEAELVAARSTSAKMGFFKRSPDSAPLPTGKTGDTTDAGNDEKLRFSAEPGEMMELDVGLEFEPWDPQHPTNAYGPFTKAQQRGIATGLDCNYSTLFNDLEAVNYSSGKLGQQQEKDVWRLEQDQVIDVFYERVYQEFVRQGVLSGMIQLPVGEVEPFTAAEWQPRGWISVDPLKDSAADANELAMGFTTFRDKCAQRGGNFEDNIRTLAEEYAMAEELGVTLTLPGIMANPGAGEEEDRPRPKPDDGEDEESDDDNKPARPPRRMHAVR